VCLSEGGGGDNDQQRTETAGAGGGRVSMGGVLGGGSVRWRVGHAWRAWAGWGRRKMGQAK
jgi:hypothetical protein